VIRVLLLLNAFPHSSHRYLFSGAALMQLEECLLEKSRHDSEGLCVAIRRLDLPLR